MAIKSGGDEVTSSSSSSEDSSSSVSSISDKHEDHSYNTSVNYKGEFLELASKVFGPRVKESVTITCTQLESLMFQGEATVLNERFVSKPHSQKKEAEKEAASKALQYLKGDKYSINLLLSCTCDVISCVICVALYFLESDCLLHV